MASRKSRGGARDTAKDIILGLAPSGQGPRQPKEGVSHKRDSPPPRPVARPTQPVPPTVVVDRRPDQAAIQGIQSQMAQLERHNKELIAAEQAARRRLEANQDAIHRRLMTSDPGQGSRETDDIRRQLSATDGRIMAMSSDVTSLRGSLDRMVHDLLQINNEIKNRPVVDPSKIASSTQQLDGKIRDLHSQMMQLKQQLDAERTDRGREARTLGETIGRLQDIIRQQDQSKTDILNNLTRKGDKDKEKLSEEAKRLNERIGLITTEVTRNLSESQARLRDEINGKYGTLESALRIQGDAIAELARDGRRSAEAERVQAEQMEALGRQIQVDRAKQKDRFAKVNEALAALEHHLELGNKKMDKILNAEMQSRKLHEKGLLSKITEVEEKLAAYMGGLNKSIDDVRTGTMTKVPALDVDALRREMEAIAADKNKLSMEGLLKLEEKMSRVQTGLYHDKRELTQKMSSLEENEQTAKLRGQLNKLDTVQDDMEKAQERIRDKVEKQIPQDLNELSAKADNLKHQLNTRIDKEEEERYLAIKELQEAFQRLQAKNSAMPVDVTGPTSLRRDVDECKTAIKKLAESVTTVKNVLDKKITDETKQREREIARVSGK